MKRKNLGNRDKFEKRDNRTKRDTHDKRDKFFIRVKRHQRHQHYKGGISGSGNLFKGYVDVTDTLRLFISYGR